MCCRQRCVLKSEKQAVEWNSKNRALQRNWFSIAKTALLIHILIKVTQFKHVFPWQLSSTHTQAFQNTPIHYLEGKTQKLRKIFVKQPAERRENKQVGFTLLTSSSQFSPANFIIDSLQHLQMMSY